MYLQKVISRKNCVKKLFFCGHLEGQWRTLVRGMDPRIRIHPKMTWIRNSDSNHLLFFVSDLILGTGRRPLSRKKLEWQGERKRGLVAEHLCRQFMGTSSLQLPRLFNRRSHRSSIRLPRLFNRRSHRSSIRLPRLRILSSFRMPVLL
jgi:hypothetical protein